jgi:hypothetical protein
MHALQYRVQSGFLRVMLDSTCVLSCIYAIELFPCGAKWLTQMCSTQVSFNARDRRVGVLLGGCLLAGFTIACLVISQLVLFYCLSCTKLRLRL